MATLLMYTSTSGSGLSLTAAVWTDEAEWRSGPAAHFQHNGETEGNQRVWVRAPVLSGAIQSCLATALRLQSR